MNNEHIKPLMTAEEFGRLTKFNHTNELMEAYARYVVANQPEKVCEWTLDEDGINDTQCNNRFYFDDCGTPIQHGFKLCPYCGGRIVVKQ